jgi:hypothetical protein
MRDPDALDPTPESPGRFPRLRRTQASADLSLPSPQLARVIQSRPAGDAIMLIMDPKRLPPALNADPEFRIAARFWTITLSLESPPRVLRIEIENGRAADCRESEAGQPATITVSASSDGWAQFLAPEPRPFYQDLLGGCVQHHGFQVSGDVLSLSAYYRAVTRLFAVMRALGAETGGSG